MIDATHDPQLSSWVASANGHADFPIQNLPFGIFSPPATDSGQECQPRGGVAIGDSILDIGEALARGLITAEAQPAANAAAGATLNAWLEQGVESRLALRRCVSRLLSEATSVGGEEFDRAAMQRAGLLYYAADCTLQLPAHIGDYTDFYAGINHASTVGKILRPDAPLLPNYKHLPIAYHGRASSIRTSGTPVRRPWGQTKSPDAENPTFSASRRLDFELELGVWIGPSTNLGEPLPIARAHQHIAGYCLLNDWSARDIQAWEYQPLGPFLAKNFLTSISPWIVTAQALEPFRQAQAPRPAGDPQPLPYLWEDGDQAHGALNIGLEVYLSTAGMRLKELPAQRISRSNSRYLYWTVAQMLTHHTSGGCNLRAGDLLGSGTISAESDGYGSLLEISDGGKRPLTLSGGEQRTFLQDGDEILIRARAERAGFVSIGFGECRGIVVAAGATL